MVRRTSRLKAAVVGFAAAICVFAVLFWLIDVDRFLQALGRTRLSVVGVMLVIAFGWLTAWSLSLRTVLGVLDVKPSVPKAFFVFAGALFSNNVTPFGQAGGEPVAAVFIAQMSDIDYETGLASIASVDAIHLVPSISFALLGLAYYAIFVTLGQYLVLAAIIVTALAVIVPVFVYLGWLYRYRLEHRVIEALTPLLRRGVRIIPRVSAPEPQTIETYVSNFFSSIERVATDRRGVVTALAFSALGWLLQMAMLWLSFFALGQRIPLPVVLLVIPIGNVASIAPFPGGLSGIESVFIVLLGSLTSVNLAVITAAVVVYRTLVYGVPTLIGGGTIAMVSIRASSHGS